MIILFMGFLLFSEITSNPSSSEITAVDIEDEELAELPINVLGCY